MRKTIFHEKDLDYEVQAVIQAQKSQKNRYNKSVWTINLDNHVREHDVNE